MATSAQDFSNGVATNKEHEAPNGEYVEKLDPAPTHGTYFGDAKGLSNEHRQYLLGRHGTYDLDPIPDMGEADPYNWPQWKAITNLTLVAIHACMSTFTAAAIIPAYETIAIDLGVSLQRVTYLTSLQICILGVAPLIWKPFSNTYGRRPLFLLSLICSLVGNIGCAKSPSYATMALCRAIVAFFISPAAAIGSAVVTETFFKKERARYMGIWTLMVTLGVPLSPFIFGFVAYHVGYRWIYWILAMINGVQFLLYLFFGPETRYIRLNTSHPTSAIKTEYYNFSRIDPRPLTFRDFVHPLTLVAKPCIVIPAIAYAMTFLFGSVMITVELPQLFGAKFGFNAQQLGLQFLGIIIGSVIGEQLGGSLSDFWMNSATKKHNGRRPAPEYRLWLSYAGFILTIVGAVVFLVQTQNAGLHHWNISPVIGIAIAGAGNQIVTTVLITYAVDCHLEESASIGVFITFVRQIWGFIGPFWFPDMFDNLGLAASAGVATALIVGVSILPMIGIQLFGKRCRGSKEESERSVGTGSGTDVEGNLRKA
ncbi:MFS general substrate transporter [Mollisia scopiformis]|uniref:MFS general substrate transporter n=1 Tax=Mollisia scopiformis TaxID=149040 RepID=A0A132B5Z4_MOLSC|nr:MFS general substrate transporter [Mollisia scopiformis]KUJ07822.1 MFS general substrate transporter [Mollisia scopiformis]